MLCYKLLAIVFYLLPDLPKLFPYFFLCSFCLCRIGKVAVVFFCCCGEERAAFPGIVANRNHKIKIHIAVFTDAVGRMAGDVYVVFFHDAYSSGICALHCTHLLCRLRSTANRLLQLFPVQSTKIFLFICAMIIPAAK